MFDKESKIYYVGPLNYFTKNNLNFKSIKNNKSYNESEIKVIERSFKDVSLKKNQTKSALKNSSVSLYSTPTTTSQKILTGTPRLYNYNPTGICGSVAASILLMYYRDYRYSWVVPSWHVSSDGVSLINLLVPQIEGADRNGSITSDVVYGLNWYFRWRGISKNYTAYSKMNVSFSEYKNIINSNRPAVVGITGHPEYKEHWVFGYGYKTIQYDYNYSVDYYIVNDGWGRNNITISKTYVDHIIYLNR